VLSPRLDPKAVPEVGRGFGPRKPGTPERQNPQPIDTTQVAALVEAFLASGGKIKTFPARQCTINPPEADLSNKR